MIKNIVKDIEFLKVVSTEATIDDKYIADDLRDTLSFNRGKCVGMAANMIGYHKRIIIFEDENNKLIIMFNPKIIKGEKEYSTEEGCLSLTGVRPTKRYLKIKVEYYNEEFKKRIMTYQGFVAQIIQHEIDHCNGIII